MIKHMFVFGVIIPTLITITVFIGFLVCWFKFNMRERILGKLAKKKAIQQTIASKATTDPNEPRVIYRGPNQGPKREKPPDRSPEGHEDPEGGNPNMGMFSSDRLPQSESGELHDDAWSTDDMEAALCANMHTAQEGRSTYCSNPYTSQPNNNIHKQPQFHCPTIDEIGEEMEPLNSVPANEVTEKDPTLFHKPGHRDPRGKYSWVDLDEGEMETDDNYGHMLPIDKLPVQAQDSICKPSITDTLWKIQRPHRDTRSCGYDSPSKPTNHFSSLERRQLISHV